MANNEVREQEGEFLLILLSTLGDSLLGNLFRGKGAIRAGEGTITAREGTIRAGKSF